MPAKMPVSLSGGLIAALLAFPAAASPGLVAESLFTSWTAGYDRLALTFPQNPQQDLRDTWDSLQIFPDMRGGSDGDDFVRVIEPVALELYDFVKDYIDTRNGFSSPVDMSNSSAVDAAAEAAYSFYNALPAFNQKLDMVGTHSKQAEVYSFQVRLYRDACEAAILGEMVKLAPFTDKIPGGASGWINSAKSLAEFVKTDDLPFYSSRIEDVFFRQTQRRRIRHRGKGLCPKITLTFEGEVLSAGTSDVDKDTPWHFIHLASYSCHYNVCRIGQKCPNNLEAILPAQIDEIRHQRAAEDLQLFEFMFLGTSKASLIATLDKIN